MGGSDSSCWDSELKAWRIRGGGAGGAGRSGQGHRSGEFEAKPRVTECYGLNHGTCKGPGGHVLRQVWLGCRD